MTSKLKAKIQSKAKPKSVRPAKKSSKLLQTKGRRAAPTAAKARSKVSSKPPARSKKPASKGARPPVSSNGLNRIAATARKIPEKPAVVTKPRPLAGALTAYEAGIKLMYTESYDKAIKAFHELIEAFPEEPEILASARARIHACEMKLHERARSVYRSADDHYNVAVALMNRGEIDSALTHLQSALKMAPKGDHILYAIAAANALRGNKDQALSYLKQSIHHRPENRFQAAKDNDFAALNEEPDFRELLNLSDK